MRWIASGYIFKKLWIICYILNLRNDRNLSNTKCYASVWLLATKTWIFLCTWQFLCSSAVTYKYSQHPKMTSTINQTRVPLAQSLITCAAQVTLGCAKSTCFRTIVNQFYLLYIWHENISRYSVYKSYLAQKLNAFQFYM